MEASNAIHPTRTSATPDHTGPHGRCYGLDPLAANCSCPDLAYIHAVRLHDGRTIWHRWICACCDGELQPLELPL